MRMKKKIYMYIFCVKSNKNMKNQYESIKKQFFSSPRSILKTQKTTNKPFSPFLTPSQHPPPHFPQDKQQHFQGQQTKLWFGGCTICVCWRGRGRERTRSPVEQQKRHGSRDTINPRWKKAAKMRDCNPVGAALLRSAKTA